MPQNFNPGILVGDGLQKVRGEPGETASYPRAFTSTEGGGSSFQSVAGWGEMEGNPPDLEQSSGVQMGALSQT